MGIKRIDIYFSCKLKNLIKKCESILKNIYNQPKKKPWLILKRAGYRAELYYYYKPKMQYIRVLYEQHDYMMLNICLKELKNKSLYFVKNNLGFSVTPELFEILIEILRFQGRDDDADKLIKLTIPDLMKPIIESEDII